MIGKSLDDLSTPAVLVDLDVLERNIARMASRAREAGVRLRPHAKTHKCPQIGRLQRAAGAWGLSVAKVGEAEVFADAGFDDLFVAYPVVGEDKGRRLRGAGRPRAPRRGGGQRRGSGHAGRGPSARPDGRWTSS